MSDAPLAIRQKLEAAAKAYLVARIAALGPNALTPVDLRVRQEVPVGNRFYPRIILEALRAPALEEMNDLYMVEFMAALGGLATEAGVVPAEAQSARTGLLTEWFADRPAFTAYCSGATIALVGYAGEAAVNIAYVWDAALSRYVEPLGRYWLHDSGAGRWALWSVAAGANLYRQATTGNAQPWGAVWELVSATGAVPVVVSAASPVADLLVHDILLNEEQGEQTGEHWLDVMSYNVPCQLVNAV